MPTAKFIQTEDGRLALLVEIEDPTACEIYDAKKLNNGRQAALCIEWLEDFRVNRLQEEICQEWITTAAATGLNRRNKKSSGLPSIGIEPMGAWVDSAMETIRTDHAA